MARRKRGRRSGGIRRHFRRASSYVRRSYRRAFHPRKKVTWGERFTRPNTYLIPPMLGAAALTIPVIDTQETGQSVLQHIGGVATFLQSGDVNGALGQIGYAGASFVGGVERNIFPMIGLGLGAAGVAWLGRKTRS